jgi:polysaccharide biosynthesis protein PslH
MRILFLSNWYPFPPANGSKLRIYNLLRGLSTKHQVDLVSFADPSEPLQAAPELRSICQDIEVVESKPYRPNSLQSYLGYFSFSPRSVIDSYSKEMQRCIEQKIRSRPYDLIIASQASMARYCQGGDHIAMLLDEIEVGVLFDQFNQATGWRRFRNGLTWAKHRNYLARMIRSSSACTVVSEQERQLLIRHVPCQIPVEVVPNCISLPDYQGVNEYPQPETLVFTGSFRYHANYDAMLWFLMDIFPLIQAEIPTAKLIITGDHANLPLPGSNGVTLTGFVKDIRSLITSSAVSIAPIRIGGGTRLKIIEAMALRKPVVSTTKGAEGLDVTPGKNILIADSPGEYARAVCRLLLEPELGQKLVENARQLIVEKYDWAVVLPKFLDLVESLPDVRSSHEYKPDTIQ